MQTFSVHFFKKTTAVNSPPKYTFLCLQFSFDGVTFRRDVDVKAGTHRYMLNKRRQEERTRSGSDHLMDMIMAVGKLP